MPDIGFRVLKLDTSSLRDTSETVSATNQEDAMPCHLTKRWRRTET